jgi:hypothetical protein
MQTLNDALGLQQPDKGAPMGEMAPMDLYGPSDVEEIFREPRPGLVQPKPMQVRTADASGQVPLPERAPDVSQYRDTDSEIPPMPERGERSPEMFKGPLIQPNDSRYTDTSNLVVADVIMGGLLPWVQATADLASGRIPIEQFDNARIEHEKRIEEIKAGHPQLVGAAEKALPFLSGLGIGVIKPAKTVMGTVGRGAAVAGAQGAVQGYTSGDPEMSSGDPERLGNAIGEGATSAVLGGFGASLPAAASEGKAMLGRRAARIEREDQASAAAEKNRLATEKRQATTERNKQIKARALAEKQRDDQLVERFQSYRDVMGKPVKDWKVKRDLLNNHPDKVFEAQARMNATVEDFSRQVNLPPVAILQKLRGQELKLSTPQERSLYKQLEEIEESWQAVRRRGMKMESKTDAPAPAASADPGPSGNPASGSAKPAATPGAAGAGTRPKRTRSKPTPAPERRPGDEPIRTPIKPNRSDRSGY